MRSRLATWMAILITIAAGCVPEGEIAESPQNRTLIMEVSDWNNRGLEGKFEDPIYPVSLTFTGETINFTTEVVGWQAGFGPPRLPNSPHEGNILIRTGSGFPLADVRGFFAQDMTLPPEKLLWRQMGGYAAGSDGFTSRDSALAIVRFTCCISDSKGMALLPWKFASAASAINGAVAAEVGSQVWVQAVASGLIEPVTYSWQLDGSPLPGVTGTFYSTTFSTPGGRDFTVTMTGANGAVDVKNWSTFVTCVGGGLVC